MYYNISDCPMIAMAKAATALKGLGPSTSLVTRYSDSDSGTLMYMHTVYNI